MAGKGSSSYGVGADLWVEGERGDAGNSDSLGEGSPFVGAAKTSPLIIKGRSTSQSAIKIIKHRAFH